MGNRESRKVKRQFTDCPCPAFYMRKYDGSYACIMCITLYGKLDIPPKWMDESDIPIIKTKDMERLGWTISKKYGIVPKVR